MEYICNQLSSSVPKSLSFILVLLFVTSSFAGCFTKEEEQKESLPIIHDLSGAPSEHVTQLVIRALDGLGLDEESGPNEKDRVFVGLWYIAWIDETGFYGKMNGLWSLNGNLENLDFTMLENDRPVNLFIVGENGEGKWPAGYKGAEHIEFPNNVPEEDDNDCGEEFGLCSQYSLGEASNYTDPDIPTWRACNSSSPTWKTHFQPIELVESNTGLRIIYEGLLTKQGDFGGSTEGNGCHENYLFEDGIRRPVYLRVGYELDSNTNFIDRILQVRNPDGNPQFDGPHGFIGGFVITEWPNPHLSKQFHQHVRVMEKTVGVTWNNHQINFEPGVWTSLPDELPNHDVVLGWAGQPVTLSTFVDELNSTTMTLTNIHLDDDDSGFCLCIVHGAIEIGGGLIHYPVESGELSEEATRRLTINPNY